MTEDAVSPTPPSTPPSRVMLEHPFWRFSLAVYGRAGVAETVLNFQDRRGAQVNVILFVLWLTAMGQDVSDILLSRAISVSRDWQESVVGPVRRARRAVKGMEGLYSRLKETELACEHAEQMALAALVCVPDGGGSASPGARRHMMERTLRAYVAGPSRNALAR